MWGVVWEELLSNMDDEGSKLRWGGMHCYLTWMVRAGSW